MRTSRSCAHKLRIGFHGCALHKRNGCVNGALPMLVKRISRREVQLAEVLVPAELNKVDAVSDAGR
jgi:hypothetical protein